MSAPEITRVTEIDGEWFIPLGPDHSFPTAKMFRSLSDAVGYTVVIVDAAKFLACFANGDPGFLVPPAAQWSEEKRRLHSVYLAASQAMPVAHIKLRKIRESRFFGLSYRDRMDHAVSFTNGRHRSRYLEFAGARAFPVEVEIAQAQLMTEVCGWTPSVPAMGLTP